MQNGYFRMANTGMGGYGLKIFPPQDGGEPVRLNEVTGWGPSLTGLGSS